MTLFPRSAFRAGKFSGNGPLGRAAGGGAVAADASYEGGGSDGSTTRSASAILTSPFLGPEVDKTFTGCAVP